MTLDEARKELADYAADEFPGIWDQVHLQQCIRVVLAALPTLEQANEPTSLSESVTRGTVASMVAVVQPPCEHCGKPLACPGGQAERIAGLEAMHEEALGRAEKAERERDAFEAALCLALRVPTAVGLDLLTEAAEALVAHPAAADVAPPAPDTTTQDLVTRLLAALSEVANHCPCGHRPESPDTHPHVGGCPVAKACEIADALAAAPPADLVVFRKRAQDLALYAFSRHGDDAYLYNALADIGGVSSDGKGWLPQSAPPADLVALVLEWQAAEVAWDGSGRSAKRQNDAYHALISWRPSAPPEPHHEAPQGTK